MKTTFTAIFAGAALFNTLSVLAGIQYRTPEIDGPLIEESATLSYEYTIPIAESLEVVLKKGNESLYRYPTDITRGVVPKPIHSHNDYWRDLPFWTGLAVGAISTEADVWLYNETLFVGHETSALQTQRTFASLYINPILSVLERTNPSSAFVDGATRNGVFDTDSAQTLYLWVDIKTDGATTLPYVVAALEPLRTRNYLTLFNGDATIPGPITVIFTGNTPVSLVRDVTPRDYFVDAALHLLETEQSDVTSDISPIASTDFKEVFGEVRAGFNVEQLETLRKQVRVAKERGIGARYWDTPAWPVRVRNAIWWTLWEEGVILINVDDLEAGAGFGGRW